MIKPKLPMGARRAGIKGPVVLEVKIDEKGNVSVLRVIQGHPALNGEATRAVKQWKYEPIAFQGESISVISTVVVSFQDTR